MSTYIKKMLLQQR